MRRRDENWLLCFSTSLHGAEEELLQVGRQRNFRIDATQCGNLKSTKAQQAVNIPFDLETVRRRGDGGRASADCCVYASSSIRPSENFHRSLV